MNPRLSNVLDPTYGQDGLANLRSNVSWVHAIVTVPGGAFACGTSNIDNYTCFRLDEQGELDTSWGNQGAYGGQFKPGDRAKGTGLLPLADGKLLMLGLHTERFGNQRKEVPALVRFNANGLPDTTFGDRGHKILHELNAGAATDAQTAGEEIGVTACHDRRPREDGGDRIYLNVTYPVATGIVARLNADGSLDSSFNGNGIKYMTSPGGSRINVKALHHDAGSDRLLICGNILLDGVARPCVIRLTADGQEDPSFGDRGHVVIGDVVGSFEGVALRDGHEILCVGAAGYTSNRTLLHAFDSAGGPLPGFVPSSTDFAGVDGNWSRIAIDTASGALVTLGFYATSDADLVVGRFLADGRIDSSFADGRGWANVPLGSGAEIPRDLALEASGRALVCGVDLGGDTPSRGFVARCLTGSA